MAASQMPGSPTHGGHSMAAALRRVLVCTPEVAGWGDPRVSSSWPDLGYRHCPDVVKAGEQHARLRAILRDAGAEVVEMEGAPDLTLDAIYVRDASLITDGGAVCFRTGKATRRAEGPRHRAFYESVGIPVLGEVFEPGVVEGGDLVWLDESTLLAGRGTRTSWDGIDQLSQLLTPQNVKIISAPLIWGGGPEVCFHLMSILSVPSPRVALVDLELMAVETVELLRRLEYSLVPIDPAERATMAANVLGLGGTRALALEENPRTNARLRAAGIEVLTFPGSELCQNGSGGPTCLTRPLLRS